MEDSKILKTTLFFQFICPMVEGSEKFKCYVCNENFDQYGLELHYATTHAFEEDIDKSQDKRCEHCGKCFTRLGNLNQHIKVIHEYTGQQTKNLCKQRKF